MLVIRTRQMDVLARKLLINTLTEHARQVAPRLCAEMTPKHLFSVIDHCLKRCAHYGIKREYDILRYLNLMLVFGVSFDTDQPWATEALAYRNPGARMEILMDRALRLNAPPPESEDE